MEWIKVKIGDLCKVGRGSSPRPIYDIRYFEGGTIPWIKIADATASSRKIYKTKQYVNDLGASYSRKLPAGSLILATSGTLGYPYFLGVEGCIHDGWLYVSDLKGISKDWFYYKLITLHKYFNSLAYGAAIQNINTDILRETEIELPPIEKQQKIAQILSEYDDLIENNTRRIKILEEMAQTIYKEWFVNFRFPGHEKAKFVDSPLGEIPVGWEVVEVRDIVKRLKAGNVYTEKEVNIEGDVIVIDQSTEEYLGFHNNEPDHNARPEKPIIIFGDHTCKMQIIVEPFSVGPNVIPFTTNGKTTTQFLFYLVNELVETKEYKRHWNELVAKKVVLPRLDIQEEFSRIVTSNLEMIDTLKIKNQNLRKTRDLLLPKLMSGEVEV